MTRVPMTQAVAADYADAMLVARRAKNALFFFLALALLLQLGIFFAARYVPNLKIRTDIVTSAPESAGTASSTSVTLIDRRPVEEGGVKRLWSPTIQYIIAGTTFLAMILSMALAVVLLILIMIMLVGRLVGVSHVTSAFCWSIVLIVILFPWQTLLNSQLRAAPPSTMATTQPSIATTAEQIPDVRVPGVLYTYPELLRDYDFPNTGDVRIAVLKWSRFVAFPAIALLMLLRIQGRSRRGLRYALGEAEVIVEQQ